MKKIDDALWMRDGYCEHHKPNELGYIQWHNWAAKRINQKYVQVKCKICKRYLFPDELNEPDNARANQIIESHKRYLENHPKAKSVVFKQHVG